LDEYFFGSPDVEAAPQAIELPNRIASGRWFRDFGLFWKVAPQLIQDENALAGIAKAESDISTLLGGMVTLSEVLQYFGPDIEFVAVQPIDDPNGKPPSIRFPAFGITGTLREPAKAQPALRLAFQQVISFSNLNAAAASFPPLEVMAEREGEQLLVTGSYFAMDGAAMSNQPGSDVYKNFSPTLGFQQDRFVLTSHRDLAKQILAAPRPPRNATPQSTLKDNTVLELWPRELAIAGEINREPLIAQRMLTTGQGRESAAAEIDLTLALLKQFESATLRLQASESALVLEFDTQLVTGTSSNEKR
jgi:hypothetical protein